MYHVMNWDTREVISSWPKLSIAKRYCRGQGHTGLSNGVYLAPVAYVADEGGLCVYNPRFKDKISAAVGGLINANDDHLR